MGESPHADAGGQSYMSRMDALIKKVEAGEDPNHKVLMPSREVLVRPELRYTTKPQKLPTLVFPNFGEESVHYAATHESAHVVESDLQMRESVRGFKRDDRVPSAPLPPAH